MNTKYYDGTKLLSMLDINGRKPEIFICTTNRTGGKTTYFSRLMVNRFLDRGEKFAILYRFNYELDDCADKFFKDIGKLFLLEILTVGLGILGVSLIGMYVGTFLSNMVLIVQFLLS